MSGSDSEGELPESEKRQRTRPSGSFHASPSSLVRSQADKTKPRILLCASGSVAAIKVVVIAQSLSRWAQVKIVSTKAALNFFDKNDFPPEVTLYTDEDEWSNWKKLGDGVLHIELRRWADLMIIAPLSANTLAKIANGLCDNLLTCVVRAWDFTKPLLVAPSMNTHMWENPFTIRHVAILQELGIKLVNPIVKKLACGDIGNGAMAEPDSIELAIRLSLTR